MYLAGQQSVLCMRHAPRAELPHAEREEYTWAWPMAFAAMTAMSAVLLVMVMQKPNAQIVRRAVEKTVAMPMVATDVATRYRLNDLEEQYFKDSLILNWLSFQNVNNQKSSDADSSYSYPALLRQIIARGVDSWKPSGGGTVDSNTTITRPPTSRELMKQFLNQPGMSAG
jgi:hypothetical protein